MHKRAFTKMFTIMPKLQTLYPYTKKCGGKAK